MASKKTKKKGAATSRSVAKKASKRSAKKAPAKRAAARKTRKPSGHQVVHWEIQSRNPARLHDFYAQALGWKINADNPMNYGMVASGGPAGIDGGIGGTEGSTSRVLVYVSVPSIPPVLERIESLGGRTVMPRTDIGPVIMSLYEDPEGNVMGLIEG